MSKGIVAAGSDQGAEAGAEILRRGGNAVDAAVAAVFVSFVTEPAISTLGGGGFAAVASPGAQPALYDFFVTPPGRGRAADPPADLDFRAIPIRYESTTCIYHAGRGSSAVPGNVAGLCALIEERGSLPLAAVLDPAIRLAEEGYPFSPIQAYAAGLVQPILYHDASSRRYFTPKGHLIRVGETFSNPELASSLKLIAREGAAVFYRGTLADEIVRDHAEHGGLITAEDLAAYEVVRRRPLIFRYRDLDIFTNPPPSLGGILIAYSLRLLEEIDWTALRWGDASHVALLAETARLTHEARRRDLPQTFLEPRQWAAWLSDDALRDAQRDLRRSAADGPGPFRGAEPRSPRNTTHVSALDGDGLAVAITTTPGETGGYSIGETGILMNNVLGEEDLNPDGFHTFPPGGQLSSMMAPTVVSRDGLPILVAGSGGSTRLRTAMVQFMSNVIDWGMSLRDAVDRPRVHWEDGFLHLEGGADPAAAGALEAKGYSLVRWEGKSIYFGGTHVVGRLDDGTLTGAGDGRRGGAVAASENASRAAG
jgi:gamma-glutamyltranspeptidase/glutathione hydrolase